MLTSKLLRLAAVLPVCGLAAVAIAGSVQTGCSSPASSGLGDDAGEPADTGVGVTGSCQPSEFTVQVEGLTFCCSGDAKSGTQTCTQPQAPTSDEPCATPNATTQGAATATLTHDVCVQESCNGDRTSDDFVQTVTVVTPTLTCVDAASGTPVWKDSSSSEHTVVRACVDAGQKRCDGSYGYGYGSYGSGYGYSFEVTDRQVQIASSTCSTDGAAAAPCPPGAL